MTMPTISLCVITGNEEVHAERFLDAFGGAFDELCLVRAIGRGIHDRTVSICKKWCETHGKKFRFAEYVNAHLTFCHPDSPLILDDDPSTWPHVDDFAAARNMAWALATCDWQFWADLDDIINPESVAQIRTCSLSTENDFFYFHYAIPTSGERNYRERMFRRGISHWSQPVHENCHAEPDKAIKKGHLKASEESGVVFTHEPLLTKQRDPVRNIRIMQFSLRYLAGFAEGLHKEYFYRWGAFRKKEDMDSSFQWANIAEQTGLMTPLKQGIFLNLAEMLRNVKDYDQAKEYAWKAIRISPKSRDPWGVLAELELESGQVHRAAAASNFMQVITPAPVSGLPQSDRFMGAAGLTLRTRCLRASGDDAGARALEDRLLDHGGEKFSLLHATRGRPAQALKARETFFKAAYDQLGIEHCFAIDSDDTASLEALKHYRHIVIDPPGGCVKAWNALAEKSKGKILVQMSDDWIPCIHWDGFLWQEAEKATKARGGESAEVGSVPLVFAISDGHRSDFLLCMAILTRARYQEQNDGAPIPYLFSPEYFGVFSDNEFTARAYHDNVVVDCRHIVMAHQHPIFEGKPPAEWDETYRRQNAVERYTEGEAIFRRRNPWAIKL